MVALYGDPDNPCVVVFIPLWKPHSECVWELWLNSSLSAIKNSGGTSVIINYVTLMFILQECFTTFLTWGSKWPRRTSSGEDLPVASRSWKQPPTDRQQDEESLSQTNTIHWFLTTAMRAGMQILLQVNLWMTDQSWLMPWSLP